ncbi:hypothetical protein [Avibacterium endocarditidis]|uniref:hypothetical protein n=1 Tax=Avibacterium TaxID=292486 RepID=UPI0039FD63BC
MIPQKVLPKKAYTLAKAAEYISINYGIKIDQDDLLDYLRDGILVSSVNLKGNNQRILEINHKKECYKGVLIEPYGCNFKIDAKVAKVDHFLNERTHIFYTHPDLSLTLFFYRHIDDFFEEQETKITNGGEPDNFYFRGYFKIPSNCFEDISNGIYIDFPMELSINSHQNDSSIFIDNSTIQLCIMDICILHKDLTIFLSNMGIIDEQYKTSEEFSKLNSKISQLEKEQSVSKLATKTKNTMARLIVNLLELQYGYTNHSQIIKGFKKKGEDNMPEDGEILQDFSTKGLQAPSSKFIRGILGDLEEK